MTETTAQELTAAELADLLAGQLRKVCALAPDRPKGRQDLMCAADVAEALAAVAPKAERSPQPWDPANSLAALVNIPVIVSPDSAPGTWRLVTHDGCEVRGLDGEGADVTKAWVSHQRCTVTAEGRIG